LTCYRRRKRLHLIGSISVLLRGGLFSVLLLSLLVTISQVPVGRVNAAISVEIVGVYTTNMSGANMTTFSRGQTIIVWVAVRNSGSDLDFSPLGPIIWIEVVDPRNSPFTVQFHIGVLLGGGRISRAGFSVLLAYGPGLTDIPLGRYKSNAFVSDKMIALGGSFFAPQVSTTFDVSL